MKIICRKILHSCGHESKFKPLALVESDDEAEFQLEMFKKYSDFILTRDMHYMYRFGYPAEETDDIYYKIYDPKVFNNAKGNLRAGRVCFEINDKVKYHDTLVIFENNDEDKLLEFFKDEADIEYDEIWIESEWVYKITK